MLKYRNFGKKSLSEIKKMIEDMNLHFGMDISHLKEEKKTAKDE